jgi:hypothetical protein
MRPPFLFLCGVGPALLAQGTQSRFQAGKTIKPSNALGARERLVG